MSNLLKNLFGRFFKKLEFSLLLAAFTFLIIISSGNTATYYMSPTGNDSNSGTTESQPWRNFTKAWQVLQPGDTLILLDGTYNQSMNIGVNGVSGNPVTIKAKNDGKAIIDGENVRIPVQGGWPAAGGHNVIIEGIIAQNSSGVVMGFQSENFVLRRCSAYWPNQDVNTGAIMVWSKFGPALVEDCIAHGNGRKQVWAYHSSNVTFRRVFAACGLHRGATWCSNHWPWDDGIEFYNNDADTHGGSHNNTMENCILYGKCSNYGISLSPHGVLNVNNKILGCMSVKIGMEWDGTVTTWPRVAESSCSRGYANPWNTGCCYKDWTWPGMRAGFNIGEYATPTMVDTLVQDILSYGNAGAAMCSGPWNASSTNNRLIRATFKNCGLGTPTPWEGTNMEVRQEYLNVWSAVTDCYIEDVNGGTSHNGGGAIIIKRYVDGVLTDEPLWPWPMEQRIQDELGIQLTAEMTAILGISVSGDPVKLSVTASPDTISADGTSTSEITAKVYDENDIIVVTSNAQITFNITSGQGTLVGTNPVNASGGIAKITYQSATSAGTATITATSSGLIQDSANITLYANSPPSAPTELKCNNMTNPGNLTDTTPDLSWTFNDSDPGNYQTAYRILVADSQSALNSDNGNMWDTNKVPSATASATYAGLPLQVGTAYYWKVMTWDNNDLEGPYSQTGTFTMTSSLPVLVSNSSWQNYPITLQNGQFSIDFDMAASQNNMDGATGLSNGPAGAYSDLAIIVRFYTNGLIEVRNGGAYSADVNLSYTAGTMYHVRMVIDITTKTYDVTVTPDGGSPVAIATNYAFRTEQAAISAIDNLSVIAAIGSHEIYNIVVNGEVSPAITVTSPNGGETWIVGDTKTVMWTSQGTVGNVNIDLSTDGGTNWSTLKSDLQNDGQENITVPNSPGATCRIRVQDTSSSPTDMSNSNFTISALIQPQITVTVPNGGETWQPDSQQTVTWTSQGSVGNINIDLSTDGGSNWASLVSNITNDGSQAITVPNSPSTTCKIRVEDVSGSPSGTSNMNFTIEASPDPEAISVNNTTLDFGNVEIGKTGTLDFTITNTGGGILSGSITTDKKWITVEPTSFEGNTTVVNVIVDNNVLSQSEGEYTGTISIISNGGNIDVEVTLKATCVLAKPNPYDPSKGKLTFFGDGIVPYDTKIVIYTLGGKLVAELSENEGKTRIKWNGKNKEGEKIISGIYVYIYESANERGIGKFTITR